MRKNGKYKAVEVLDLRTGKALHTIQGFGNPHAVFFVDQVEAVDLAAVGPRIEHHKLFPERVSVGFAQVESPTRIYLRVWERGAGLTLACGSGACAALVNAYRRELTGRSATVVMDGGELLIGWNEMGHVTMRGPAETSFIGALEEWV